MAMVAGKVRQSILEVQVNTFLVSGVPEKQIKVGKVRAVSYTSSVVFDPGTSQKHYSFCCAVLYDSVD